MKQIGIILLLIIFSNSLIAQPKLKLKQKKLTTDLRIVNGEYEMFIDKENINSGIALIEKVLEVNYQNITQKIGQKDFTNIDLKNINPEYEDFVNLFKSNLGVLLFTKKQIVVAKKGKILKQIDTDEAPPKRSLDGVVTRQVYYLLDRNQEPFFMGEANMKVAGYE